jgi:hypothetical protein
MTTLRFVQVMALAALTASAQQDGPKQRPSPTGSAANPVPPFSCPVTRPPAQVFVPPAPYPTELPQGAFWVGTEKLWTVLHDPEVWYWTPRRPGHEHDMTNKVFWWRVGYDWRAEPRPKLIVSGRRLDGRAPPLEVSRATNAYTGTSSMLVTVYVPTPGCWEITGDYQGDKLSFVTWVVPH